MPFISQISITTEKRNPFPYNVPAVKYLENIQIDEGITFLVGDNGTGKSTILETIGCHMNLPLIEGYRKSKRGYEAALALQPYFNIEWNIHTEKGFFFRAEDFSHFVDSVERNNSVSYLNAMKGEVPDHVIDQMKESNNRALREMRKNYGQDMLAFSHGEAYMKIMHDRINSKGVFLLDEPEAALSPSKQLAMIYFILEHQQKHMSQFIIATHSPMLMAIPGAKIYQITEEEMQEVSLEETEHYYLTKGFLDNPEAFLRHL